jgi:hypothetical protein
MDHRKKIPPFQRPIAKWNGCMFLTRLPHQLTPFQMAIWNGYIGINLQISIWMIIFKMIILKNTETVKYKMKKIQQTGSWQMVQISIWMIILKMIILKNTETVKYKMKKIQQTGSWQMVHPTCGQGHGRSACRSGRLTGFLTANWPVGRRVGGWDVGCYDFSARSRNWKFESPLCHVIMIFFIRIHRIHCLYNIFLPKIISIQPSTFVWI